MPRRPAWGRHRSGGLRDPSPHPLPPCTGREFDSARLHHTLFCFVLSQPSICRWTPEHGTHEGECVPCISSFTLSSCHFQMESHLA